MAGRLWREERGVESRYEMKRSVRERVVGATAAEEEEEELAMAIHSLESSSSS